MSRDWMGWKATQYAISTTNNTNFTSGLAAIGAGHIISSSFRWIVVRKKLCCKTSQKLGYKMAGSNHELPHISLKLLGAMKKNDEETGLRWNLESGWSVQGWGALGGQLPGFWLVDSKFGWVEAPLRNLLWNRRRVLEVSYLAFPTQHEASVCQELEQAISCN